MVEVLTGTKFEVSGVRILGCEARHSDPGAVGFRFETNMGDVGYTSDTEFFEGIEHFYEGVRVLILCVLRPGGEPWKGHMTTDDAIRIVDAVKPEFVVLTHFGMKMIFRSPAKEARRLEKETGVRALAALDGLKLLVGEGIVVGSDKRRVGLDRFLKTH